MTAEEHSAWEAAAGVFVAVGLQAPGGRGSSAFSPTDAMPLTGRAKLLMLVESATAAITVLLVAARGVNILK